MKKASPQTISFVILFVLALVGTYLSFNVAEKVGIKGPDDIWYNQNPNGNISNQLPEEQNKETLPDTSNWQTYVNEEYNLQFKYPKEWKVLSAKQSGTDYELIEIDPGTKYYNIKLYVSNKDYYALGGLPTKEENIAGLKALNVSNLLYGIKNGSNYFTFDLGSSLSLKPAFNGMVRTVSFY